MKNLKEILLKRLNNFKRWNEELKGNYTSQIISLERRIKELEDKDEKYNSKNSNDSFYNVFNWFTNKAKK